MGNLTELYKIFFKSPNCLGVTVSLKKGYSSKHKRYDLLVLPNLMRFFPERDKRNKYIDFTVASSSIKTSNIDSTKQSLSSFVNNLSEILKDISDSKCIVQEIVKGTGKV
ncbi:hypothetical protein DID80_05905 [Candidatus Marinamargulisbacteria bacterium SCGC AAA071-K20]|nr:hypothetical protein DID80_05905 [Candidatus Marinamargulisbacteria bacterium SCGC AAA071-K20]